MVALSLGTLVLALAIATNAIVIRESPVKLSLSRKVNEVGIRNLLQHDQARACHLRGHTLRPAAMSSTASSVNEPIDNQGVVYVASIGVGTPPTSYNLIVDTGSSNTWIGAGQKYVQTSTSVDTGEDVSAKYGSGFFSGKEYLDTVTIASGLVITNQSIGVASKSHGLDGHDGILGIGPVDLTRGTLSGTNDTIPTVTDNAFTEGLIATEEIGISFEPATAAEVMNGELTWGGVDSTKFNGSITYTPLTTTSPASAYWGIDESITYGTSTPILSLTAGIVDTGTTLILLASDAFGRYQAATGATKDNTTGLLTVTPVQYANLQSLFFNAGGASFELTANAQIWPRALNSAIGGTADGIYIIVGDIGSPSGSGLDFINGYTFLERYYSVYDTTNGRVGFASTPFTFATTN
ncbi:hypothetical protein AX17_002995 [Amanita inopinata Kibby_2008]|nr:hypothetical protein AX17_002995 [Amanita inopinata Kibby_2008]